MCMCRPVWIPIEFSSTWILWLLPYVTLQGNLTRLQGHSEEFSIEHNVRIESVLSSVMRPSFGRTRGRDSHCRQWRQWICKTHPDGFTQGSPSEVSPLQLTGISISVDTTEMLLDKSVRCEEQDSSCCNFGKPLGDDHGTFNVHQCMRREILKVEKCVSLKSFGLYTQDCKSGR